MASATRQPYDETSGRTGRGRVVRLLGPPSIEVGGRPLSVDTRKAIAMLAYLAITGRSVPRAELAVLLWPESDDAASRGALRRTLSVLNAALGGTGLAITRSAVELVGPWHVDARRFRTLLDQVRSHVDADGACQACLDALTEAASLDRGDFMAGFALRDSETFDEWQRSEGESHRRDLGTVLERLAQARASRADWPAAIAAGRRWLELDPLHEPAHRLVMEIFVRADEQAAAIRQYRDCVRILDRELGVAPLPETTELYEAIRNGEIGQPAKAAVVGARIDDAADDPVERAADGRGSRTPLVGRDDALGRILGVWRTTATHGQVVLLHGEPGIGKTRLAAEATALASEAGAAVLRARAYPGETTIAFAPVAALVRDALDRPDARSRLGSLPLDTLAAAGRLVPAVTALETVHPKAAWSSSRAPLDALGRSLSVEALVEVLTTLVAGPVPGILLVDDADQADDSSLEVLAFLARRLAGRRLVLLLAASPAMEADGRFRRLLAAARLEDALVTVPLERLSRGEVARLAVATLGGGVDASLVDDLHAESEGLPLYVAEALASSERQPGVVPRSVLELLRARIAAVGELAAQVVAAASVVGRSFDFDTVRAASGRSEEETVTGLEELIRRGIVVEVGTVGPDVRLDFTHGRLREAAYDRLGLVRRRLLHRRVADALRSRSGHDDDDGARWARIANHESLAGRPAEAADAHRRAAAAARRVFANREAREHLEAALALDPSDSGEIHRALGEVLTVLGDYGAAIAHLEAAAAVATPATRASIEHALALVHARLGDWGRAASHLEAALEDRIEPPFRAALLADASAIAARRGDTVGAQSFGRKALDLADRAGDESARARACHVLGSLARARGETTLAAQLLERSLAASGATDDPGLRIAALNTLALVRADAGDRASAIPLIRDALALCDRIGDRHRQAALENNLADVLRAEGRREESMDHLKKAVAIFADIEGRPGVLEPEIWKLVEW